MIAVDSFNPHTPASAAALARAGVKCALRYHYNATRAEVDRLHYAGVSFCLIAEFDTNSPVVHPPIDTPGSGGQHAERAVAIARNLGMPAGCVIYLTADTLVRPRQFNDAGRYWSLAAPILRGAGFRVGAYGGSLLIDWLIDQGLADVSWEAAARSWSSATGSAADYQPSRTASLRQLVGSYFYGGVEVDHNEIVRPHAGEWLPDGTVSGGGSPQLPKEGDMARPRYRFPNRQFDHPHADFACIDLELGAYPTPDGVEHGFHWRHLGDAEYLAAVQRGFIDPNTEHILAAGDESLDDFYGAHPHILPGARYAAPPVPIQPQPVPAAGGNVDDATVAAALERIAGAYRAP